MMRRLWKNVFAQRHARRAPYRRPALETLEDRRVPATTWIGPGGGLWSQAANWSNGVPGNGSDVVFAPASGGANTSSVDDLNIASPNGLNSLTIDSSYSGTITVNPNLTLATALGGTVTQAGGTLNLSGGSHPATLANYGTYTWTGGSLTGGGTFVNKYIRVDKFTTYAAELVIDGDQNLQFPGQYLGVNVTNNGTILWEAGNIALNGVLTDTNTTGNLNNGLGGMSVTSPGTIYDAGTNSYFVNNYASTITVSTTQTTYFDIGDATSNVNYGRINVTSGSLVFGPPPSGVNVPITVPFVNEGIVTDNNSASGPFITFDEPFLQLANTETPSYIPQVGAGGPGLTTLNFEDGATINAGTLVAGCYVNVTGPTGSNSLSVGSGATVLVYDQVTVAGSGVVYDAGTVTMEGYTVAMQGSSAITAAGVYVTSGGLLNAYDENGVPNVINCPLANSGTVYVGAGAVLTVYGSFTQSAGTTNVIGSPAAASLNVSLGIDEIGGAFNLNYAVVTVGTQYTVEANTALNFTGNGGANLYGTVTVLGTMDFTGAFNTVFFYNNFSVTGSYAVMTMYLTDQVFVEGSTYFGSFATLDFSPSGAADTPEQYTPWYFNGGAPTIMPNFFYDYYTPVYGWVFNQNPQQNGNGPGWELYVWDYQQ